MAEIILSGEAHCSRKDKEKHLRLLKKYKVDILFREKQEGGYIISLFYFIFRLGVFVYDVIYLFLGLYASNKKIENYCEEHNIPQKKVDASLLEMYAFSNVKQKLILFFVLLLILIKKGLIFIIILFPIISLYYFVFIGIHNYRKRDKIMAKKIDEFLDENKDYNKPMWVGGYDHVDGLADNLKQKGYNIKKEESVSKKLYILKNLLIVVLLLFLLYILLDPSYSYINI